MLFYVIFNVILPSLVHYSTRVVDQHAKKSMFYETSPLPPCMAQEFAIVGVRGAAVGVRGAAVGNIGIPTYVISRGAVVRQPPHAQNGSSSKKLLEPPPP